MFFSTAPEPVLTGGRGASVAAAESGGDLLPGVQALVVAQEIAEQGGKFIGPLAVQGAEAKSVKGRLTVGLPDGLHEAAELDLIRTGEGADGLADMPAVQQPGAVGVMVFTQAFPAFIAVAQEDVEAWMAVAPAQTLELGAELGQRGGGNQEVFVGESGRRSSHGPGHGACGR